MRSASPLRPRAMATRHRVVWPTTCGPSRSTAAPRRCASGWSSAARLVGVSGRLLCARGTSPSGWMLRVSGILRSASGSGAWSGGSMTASMPGAGSRTRPTRRSKMRRTAWMRWLTSGRSTGELLRSPESRPVRRGYLPPCILIQPQHEDRQGV